MLQKKDPYETKKKLRVQDNNHASLKESYETKLYKNHAGFLSIYRAFFLISKNLYDFLIKVTVNKKKKTWYENPLWKPGAKAWCVYISPKKKSLFFFFCKLFFYLRLFLCLCCSVFSVLVLVIVLVFAFLFSHIYTVPLYRFW